MPPRLREPPKATHDFKYTPPGPVAAAFMRSNAFVRGLRGPVGGGKSVACCVEIFRRSLQQKPNEAGIRRTRWAVVRNTSPELRTTTIKTWLDWFPESVFGPFNYSPPFTHHIRKGDLDMEVIFLALDSPEDIKKLLSLELTGAWGNEARELDKAVIDGLTQRVRRFPAMKDGGPTWSGVILDSNAMEPDHWWPILAGEAPIPEDMSAEDALTLQRPGDWEFYNQPGAMLDVRDAQGNVVGYEPNPAAENTANLHPDYYRSMLQGKTRAWISAYILNRLGSVGDGKLVYPSYREETHRAPEKLRPVPGVPLLVGCDFGLTPAAVIVQRIRGRWIVLRELVATDMGAKRFAAQLRQVLVDLWQQAGNNDPTPQVMLWGDPTGDSRAPTDETTPFQIFASEGLPIVAAPTNDPVLRIEAVTLLLEQMIDGRPTLQVSPDCRVLAAGFARGYHYPRLKIIGAVRYADNPRKDRYSHVHDALQYVVLGAGGGKAVIARPAAMQTRPIVVQRPNVMERRRMRR